MNQYSGTGCVCKRRSFTCYNDGVFNHIPLTTEVAISGVGFIHEIINIKGKGETYVVRTRKIYIDVRCEKDRFVPTKHSPSITM